MEGAILSSASNSSFQAQLKNVTSALCARTLPKQRRCDPGAVAASAKHHTYPRSTLPKRAEVTCRLEPRSGDLQKVFTSTPDSQPNSSFDVGDIPSKPNGTIKLKGTLAREVANAWRSRVGAPDEPAAADRVQSLFNDIELYPTKTQVFEMLVCARQCARRKSLTLTFGEFCVFAAELRRCSRQARSTPSKQESPQWSADKDVMCKHMNGSEASPSAAPCEVFLGGSCNPTTWRSEIAIPMLKKMGITYFNPQVEDWSTELVEVEHRAKAAARALLFVLDSETRAVAASVEAAHLAAAPRDLLLVLRPYARHQTIAKETISDHEYIELSRARNTLQEAVERRGLPAFTDIPAALRCARAVLRGARTHPRQPLGQAILRLKRAFDAAGGRAAPLARARALDALRAVTQAAAPALDRTLPRHLEHVHFEHFCAAVAEIAADGENQPRNGQESTGSSAADPGRAGGGERGPAARDQHAFHAYNARLRAYGKKLRLDIPKNNRSSVAGAGPASGGSGGDEAVFTPGTERRLQRLPALLGAPTHDVYLGGVFPSEGPRPEELLRRGGYSYTVGRACDYSRMFSAPAAARRAAPAPHSPRADKKPRASLDPPPPPPPPPPAADSDDDVQLRPRAPPAAPAPAEPCDRLSASDFYAVTDDVTPQPFKGTYDEDLLLGSRVLVFSASAHSPSFAGMVLAAHYMGLRPRATVLLVQPLDPARATEYSEAAVKDYNRGRHYLTDLALRAGVPVRASTEAAIACALDLLKATS